MSEKCMRKKTPNRRGYDFSNGVRGKYADAVQRGRSVVVLAPDVAASFPDSVSVNRALRKLIRRPPAPKRRSR